MSPRRLVHVTTTDMSLELLLGPQLSAFVDAGYEVVGASAPGRYVPAIEARGVRHVPLRHATRSMAPHHDAAALLELRRLFRDLRPDVVHTHNPKPGVYGRLAARAARVPAIVNTVHGLYALPQDRWTKRCLVYGLERVAATASDAELVQNPEDVPTLRRLGISADKITVLGNGVDLSRFRPDRLGTGARRALRTEWGGDAEPAVVIAVESADQPELHALIRQSDKYFASLYPAESNHLVDIAALTEPNVRFLVVGPEDPDKSDALSAEEIDRARRDAGIVFLGMRFDVEDLYTAMDLYVLASHREGFPRSAMEAAAMGLPIIATDIRGCRQVVADGSTGILVPPHDAAALAGAIARLAADAPARAAMGAAALAKARAEFDDRRVVATTLATYDRLLESR